MEDEIEKKKLLNIKEWNLKKNWDLKNKSNFSRDKVKLTFAFHCYSNVTRPFSIC